MTIDEFTSKFSDVILKPLIALLFALAVLYFFWGIVVFIANSNSEDGKKKGGKHILWGIIGIAVMISVYGIVELIENTIYQGDTPPYRDPNFPGNIYP